MNANARMNANRRMGHKRNEAKRNESMASLDGLILLLLLRRCSRSEAAGQNSHRVRQITRPGGGLRKSAKAWPRSGISMNERTAQKSYTAINAANE
mmetsp:Transcript_5363/g.11062  ORF Transcript_5363/g.11062 Transcript_5363/m.11062 type:complete len:96 (+) Transcript_5363:778-1065(+)